MATRIRQIVSLAHDMEEAAALYTRVLGIEVSWRTELRNFGLNKLVMPTGRETFFEILQPVDQQSRAWRFLNQERARGGKYFSLIVETDDLDAILARAERANATSYTSYSSFVSSSSAPGCQISPLARA